MAEFRCNEGVRGFVAEKIGEQIRRNLNGESKAVGLGGYGMIVWPGLGRPFF